MFRGVTGLKVLVLVTLLHGTSSSQGSKKAHLKIELITYSNPSGRTRKGSCCEAISLFSQRCVGSLKKCDTFFRLKISKRMQGGTTSPIGIFTTKVWPNTNEITFGAVLNSDTPRIPNPIVIDQPHWNHPNGYLVDIEALDDDISKDDQIGLWSKSFPALTSRQRFSLTNRYGLRFTIEVTAYCGANYYGKDCRTYCVPRISYICDPASGEKICKPGYEGSNCELDINECLSNPCRNGATCSDHINGYTCRCRLGFAGSHCQNNIDDCRGVSCGMYGICEDLVNGFRCQCTVGFRGQRCETNIDECQHLNCTHGKCVDQVNSAYCLCDQGFNGTQCKNNIDDCAGVTCVNGTCLDGVNSYRCDCSPGYAGLHCDLNINECQSNPCFGEATCVDQVNGFTCSCPTGYNGQLCDNNPDDCQTAPCVQGKCKDGLNTFTCECDAGYSGQHCETLINYCEGNRCVYGNCESNISATTGYRCICNEGYSGTLCDENIQECDSSPCHNNATCIDGINSFGCLCPAGYHGLLCDDYCTVNCVQNQGSCTYSEHPPRCVCHAGFSGDNCELNVDDCATNSCGDDECIDLIDGYKCNKDDACANGQALVNQLANSFCKEEFDRRRCHGIKLLSNQTMMNQTCFSLHSFKCSSQEFKVSIGTLSSRKINTTQATTQLCHWSYNSMSCLVVANSSTKELEVVYCIDEELLIENNNETAVQVPNATSKSLIEMLREHWYYILMVLVAIILVMAMTMVVVVRISRNNSATKGRRLRRDGTLPSIRVDEPEHLYEGITYSNPTFEGGPTSNGLLDTSGHCGAIRSPDCNLYAEPFSRFLIPMNEESNYYSNPRYGTVNYHRSSEDDPVYAAPIVPLPPPPLQSVANPPPVPAALPTPTWSVRNGLPPPPPIPQTFDTTSSATSVQDTSIGNLAQVLNESLKNRTATSNDTRKIRINPLYGSEVDTKPHQRRAKKKNTLYYTHEEAAGQKS